MYMIKQFTPADTAAAMEIWNQVVEEGVAFPQTEPLDPEGAAEFFAEQDFTGLAFNEKTGEAVGLYILHPNNIGRCGHICNASYAVRRDWRGKGAGEALVLHCLEKSRELGFRLLQFNAVVASNTAALSLYRKLGFVRLGTIPGGFLFDNGHYEDIVVHYYDLTK